MAKTRKHGAFVKRLIRVFFPFLLCLFFRIMSTRLIFIISNLLSWPADRVRKVSNVDATFFFTLILEVTFGAALSKEDLNGMCFSFPLLSPSNP